MLRCSYSGPLGVSKEWSLADLKLSISVSECRLILGRHCEMAEDLDHRAGRSAPAGHSRSINRGPLVRPWSAGATTSTIHSCRRAEGVNVRDAPLGLPGSSGGNGLEAPSLVTTARPTRRIESCDKLVRLSVIQTFIDLHRPRCRWQH